MQAHLMIVSCSLVASGAMSLESDALSLIQAGAAVKLHNPEESGFPSMERAIEASRHVRKNESRALNRAASDFSVAGIRGVAIGLISGRREYWDTLQKAVLQYAPRGHILKAEGMCECSMRAGFKALAKEEPDADWYYVGDEDAYIYLDRLEELVSRYDPVVPTFMASLGHSTVYERICGSPSPIPGAAKNNRNWYTFYGGTGFIASKSMVEAVDFGKPCNHATHSSDRDASCLVGNAWKDNYRFVQLSVVQNSGNKELDLPDPHVVVHHLKPSEIQDLGDKHSSSMGFNGSSELSVVPLWHNYGRCAPDWRSFMRDIR